MSETDPRTNWIKLLRHRAQTHPDRTAFTFLPDEEREAGAWTYGELDRQARAIGARLQRHRLAGERVLLLYADGFSFLPGFLGCLYAGCIGVPLLAPRAGRRDPRLPGVLADTRPRAALTPTALLPSCRDAAAGHPAATELLWLAGDGPAGDASAWRDPGPGPDAVAYLQYTSGSTGIPRGVMLSHGNLLANCGQIERAAGVGPDTVAVFWAPFVHNAGLIGSLLQILYSGGSCYLMPPAAFLEKPMRWLRAVSRYRATHSGGSLFGYEQCVRCFRPEEDGGLDLSSWRMASGGGEPIRRAVLRRFSDTFTPYGFQANAHWHGYGLTEATLVVTGSNEPDGPVARAYSGRALERHEVVPCAENDPGAVTLVSAGRAVDSVTLAVVDPQTLTRRGPGAVGEIWVAGPQVALGYWGQEQATADTFRAFLADTGEGPFLRTGDLGFLRDGHLTITGRLKDLIIIRGRNYYAHDIEGAVEGCHPALRAQSAAAFAQDIGGEECVALVLEVEDSCRAGFRAEEAGRAAVEAVSRGLGLRMHEVVFVPASAIPRTPGGKIQRQQCCKALAKAELTVLGCHRISQTASPPLPDEPPVLNELTADLRDSAERLTRHVRRAVQTCLRLAEPPAPDADFASLGLDSLMAVTLSGALQRQFGLYLPPTLAFDFPNVRALGAYLAARLSRNEDASPAPAAYRWEYEGGLSPRETALLLYTSNLAQREPPEDERRIRALAEIRVRFSALVFQGKDFPVWEWEQPERVRELLGPCTSRATFYDRAGKVIEQATSAGPVGAIVEAVPEQGRPLRCYATLYAAAALPGPGWRYEVTDPAGLARWSGIAPAVINRHAAVFARELRQRPIEELVCDPRVARLLGGVSIAEPDDGPVRRYNDGFALVRQYWVSLKRRIQGTDRVFASPLVAPRPARGPAAPVLRAGTPAEAGVSPDAAARIDAVCRRWAADDDQPFAVCVARRGVIVLHAAYDSRDGRPMTVTTKSWLASATKPWSAALMMMLVDQRLVDLDAPVETYLPALRGLRKENPLTIRHLYTHTGGLGNWPVEWTRDERPDIEDQVALAYPLLQVGKIHAYHSQGYTLAGKVIEAVTGEAIPQCYHRHLLGPLGCTHTDLTDTHADGYSVPLDLARFAQMLLNKGAYGDRRFFREDTFEKLLPEKLTRVLGPRAEDVSGIGLFGTRDRFGHSGISGVILHIDRTDELVVVMTRNRVGKNQDRYKDVFWEAVYDGLRPSPARADSESGMKTISVPDGRQDDVALCEVILNREEQYSIWPAYRALPPDWRPAGKRGTRRECLAYIDEVWVDLRPLSLRTATSRETVPGPGGDW